MVLLVGNYPLDRQHSMQRFADLMLRGLRAAGIDVELVVPKPICGNFFPNTAVGKWLGYIDKYVLFPFQLWARLRQHRPSVVHICDHSNAMYRRSIQRVPCTVTCHDLIAVRSSLGQDTGCPLSPTGRLLQRWILRWLRRADAIACVSTATARDVEQLVRGGADRPVVAIVPLALNYDYAPMTPEQIERSLAAVPGLDPALPFALHVGSNLVRKNREGVLRIFGRCRDRWNGQLVFAGVPLGPDLAALAQKLGVAHRVVQVVDPQPELLKALYNKATALLFPSTFEGFGWPIIEAQACGCPVICSNTGPMPEAAGDAGLLHPPEDEQGFADDLLRLTNPPERAAWAARSIANAQRFSTGRMIGQYIELYRTLGAAA